MKKNINSTTVSILVIVLVAGWWILGFEALLQITGSINMIGVYAIIHLSIVAHLISYLVGQSTFKWDHELKPFVEELAAFSHDSPKFIIAKIVGCAQLILTCIWAGEKWFVVAYSLSAVFALLALALKKFKLTDAGITRVRNYVILYSLGVGAYAVYTLLMTGEGIIEAMDMAGALLIPAYFSSLVTKAFEKDGLGYTILFNLSGALLGIAAWHYGLYHIVAIEIFASLIQLGSLATASSIRNAARNNPEAFRRFVALLAVSKTVENLNKAGDPEEEK